MLALVYALVFLSYCLGEERERERAHAEKMAKHQYVFEQKHLLQKIQEKQVQRRKGNALIKEVRAMLWMIHKIEFCMKLKP